MNALSLPMFRSIQAAARELIDDKTVRAVVLHGEGRAFCAGLDVKSVMGSPLSVKANIDELLRRPDGEVSNLAQDVGYLWRRIPVPVIAAIHGVCLGGGLQIALGADMREHRRRRPQAKPPGLAPPRLVSPAPCGASPDV